MVWAGWCEQFNFRNYTAKTELYPTWHPIYSEVGLHQKSRSMFAPALKEELVGWCYQFDFRKEELFGWCYQFDFCTYPCSTGTLPNMPSNFGWRMWARPTNEEIEHVMEFGLDDVSSWISAVTTAKIELFEKWPRIWVGWCEQFNFRSEHCGNWTFRKMAPNLVWMMWAVRFLHWPVQKMNFSNNGIKSVPLQNWSLPNMTSCLQWG